MVHLSLLRIQASPFHIQGLFDLVYGDGSSAFLRHFHTAVNQDPDASVGAWEGTT
jgi:hypothetical protein